MGGDGTALQSIRRRLVAEVGCRVAIHPIHVGHHGEAVRRVFGGLAVGDDRRGIRRGV